MIALVFLLIAVVGAAIFQWRKRSESAIEPAVAAVTATATTPSVASEMPDVAALLTGPRDDLGTDSAKVSPGMQGQARYVWDGLTEHQRESGVLAAIQSNIRKEDYAGAGACKECHEKNYEKWSRHSHRWMNALATDEIVKGDFSG